MDSFLVIGMGRFGKSLATELFRMKHEVMAVDEDEDNAADIVNQVTNVIIGDAKDESVLRSFGVKDFDCVVVAMAEHLEDSILIAMMLKELGAKKIVCKAQNERHAKILSMIGADKVIRPEYDMGKRTARSLVQKNIIDFVDTSSEYGSIEAVTPKAWVGKSIAENNLRRIYGVNVIALFSEKTGQLNFSPNPDMKLNEGDILKIIGLKKDLDVIEKMK